MAGDLEGWAHDGDERFRLRISDNDRHRVSEMLREAAGEGRLDIEELDERLAAVFRAKTYGDLVPITADLPAGLQQHPPSPAVRPTGSLLPATRYDTSIAIMGSSTRRGVWEIGETHHAVSVMGGIDLDLRQARFTSPETTIRVFAFWAGVDVIVNARTRVVVDGVGIMGDFSQGHDKVEPEIGPDSPVVRVTGLALMAGVSVRRRPMPDQDSRRGRMLGH
jgi:hypothetical protein